jgi:hypothetical protein
VQDVVEVKYSTLDCTVLDHCTYRSVISDIAVCATYRNTAKSTANTSTIILATKSNQTKFNLTKAIKLFFSVNSSVAV